MKAIRSGWCETGHCARCPLVLQAADGRRREIRCDCPCHDEDDIFGPSPIPCLTCGTPIPNGEGIIPDGIISERPRLIGRVYCRACFDTMSEA